MSIEPWNAELLTEQGDYRVDTSVFEELMKLAPDPYQYMVTSNLTYDHLTRRAGDYPVVQYWSTMAPLYKEETVATKSTIRYVDLPEFIERVYYELHLREWEANGEWALQSSYTLWVQYGLQGPLHRVHRSSQHLAHAINTYIDFLDASLRGQVTDLPDGTLPAHKQVLRFHLHFHKHPTGYPYAGPSREVHEWMIRELGGPVHDAVATESLPTNNSQSQHPPRRPPPPAPQLQVSQLEENQSSGPVEQAGISREDELSIVTPIEQPGTGSMSTADRASATSERPRRPSIGQRRPSTSMSDLSRSISNTAQDLIHGVTSKSRLAFETMQNKVANKKTPTIKALEALGEKVGVPGLYNLNGYLPVTNVDDMAEWNLICSLIPGLNPQELLVDIQARSINILRSKMFITPPQFYSAIQLIRRGSLFLAHDMGIGKTHTVLAALALRVLILTSKNVVEQAWATNSTNKHLPQGATHGSCPSQSERRGDVQCYCVPTGISRALARRLGHGLALVQFPANARAEWINAADQADFSDKSYDFVVVSSSKDVPLKFRRDLENYRKKFKMRPTAHPDGEPPAQDPDSAILEPGCMWTTAAKNADLDTSVFLVSFPNTATWRRAFTYNMELEDGSTGAYYGAPVGVSVIDEAHTAALWETPGGRISDIYAMAGSHIRYGLTHQWLVTGTPIPATPFESLSILKAAIRIFHEYKTPEERAIASGTDALLQRSALVSQLDPLFQKAAASKRARDIQAFKAVFTRVFTRNRVLRFLHSSTFFGQRVSHVPAVTPTVLSAATPLLNRRQHQALATKAAERAGPFGPPALRLGYNVHGRLVREQLYFASLFPGAAALINAGRLGVEDPFLRAEIVKLGEDRRAAVEEIPQVAENWRRVVEGTSPKLQAILREIKAMVGAGAAAAAAAAGSHPPRTAVQNPGASPRARAAAIAAAVSVRPNRMVIITPTVATAVYLWMFLIQDKFRASHGPVPVLIHQDLSLAVRDRILRRFSSETGTYTNILIGTFDTIGTAANLQRANYQILTSPLPRPREVTQAFGRTNRSGQKLVCVHKILTLEENPVDKANMAIIADATINSNVFNMSERLQTESLSHAWNAEA